MDERYGYVRGRFSTELAEARVVIHRQSSADAAERFSELELDWVYIDADHTYPEVLSDLRGWARTVRVGGLVLGDDYGVVGWWDDGVTRAVNHFTATAHNLVRLGAPADQFAFRRLRR
jgi:hypothetical protein